MGKNHEPFHELHARSAFSFLRGASSPETMVTRAADLGMSHLVITDRDGVYGSARAHHKSRELGIKAVVGAELTLDCGGVLPVIVRTREGYQNLCRMLTKAKLAAAKGQSRITWENLAAHAQGLSVLTGDHEGVLHRALDAGDKQQVISLTQRLCETFGQEHVFLEIHRRRLRHEDIRLNAIRDLADHMRLPLIASNAPLYARREDRILQDAFTCLRHHTHLDAAGLHLAANAEACLKTVDQMQSLFADLPQALAETARVIESVEFGLENLGYEFPTYEVPAGHDQGSFLREQAYHGARERYKDKFNDTVRNKIEHELAIISKLGFSGYFLVVWDMVCWTKGHGILVQGRGSAANSVVCYSLGITNAEPISGKLLFERFLSEGQSSWPDIDLDLPSGVQRERVIQEMYRRFAPHGAAMTANVITYRGRSAMREMGKVLNLPQDVIERFTDLYANGDFPHTLKLEEQVKQAGLPNEHPRLRPFLSLYSMVYGLPRHLGQHSGGMVICQGQLDRIVPLENASMPGRVVVQWDKDDCEDLGIVKVDFLGLGMMAVLQDTFALCRARGYPIELYTVPPDDPATYATMQRADTVGVFQIESRAQMASLPRMRPACFYDVAMQVAIVRPGPIVGNLAHPLVRRRNGLEPVSYIDPSVDDLVAPILRRTLGVILFQEQMLELAIKLADFTGGEAEELRRSMGFVKNDGRLQRALAKLVTALRAKGRSEAVVKKVSESALSFAAYGFPESHALSFALLAYASTWLKVHRPAEFTASLLNHQPMGFYSPATLLQDGRRHGLKAHPVCVAHSDWRCTVEAGDTIRIGLRYVKGLREAAARTMLAARAERPFASLDDFLRRTSFNPAERRALAAVGALNVFTHHRRAALWQVEAAWSEDEGLFRHFASESDAAIVPLAAMTLAERLRADFTGLELTTGVHPMVLIRPRLPDVWRAADLTLVQDGERVTIAGSVICRQRPGTAKGFVFISLEDETGIANAIVLPQLFEAKRLVITQESALRITGKLQNLHGVIHVKAQSIEPLAEAALPAQASHDFH